MGAQKKMIQDDSTNSDIADLLLSWYQVKKRDLPWRKTKDPYTIWVSEVMLQQTQVKTVIPYYERFLQRFPNIKKLGESSIEEVLTEWRGLGYYVRARRMWEGAQYLLAQRAGKMPGNYDQLLKVPGIGKYTAGAIASIAFKEKVSAIDGNVLRVMSRLLAWVEPIESIKSYRYFDQRIAAWQSVFDPGDFNQALMELGAIICTPQKPNCLECPLLEVCRGKKQGNVLLYPVKRIKSQRQEVTRLTFVLRQRNEIYLQKRPADGLLASLWELPGVEILPEDSREDDFSTFSQADWFRLFQEAVADRSYDGVVQKQLAQVVPLQGPIWYNFSHRRWKILWVCLDVGNYPGTQKGAFESNLNMVKDDANTYTADEQKEHLVECDRCWVTSENFREIPLPVAFRGIFSEVFKEMAHTENKSF
ncbi:A/G-specific DNA-adenine glycosylase [Desulfosporosinus acidiphilus SJ4]|uniref:Adenine DNA glycosylase n=1 Tax=Desulfosporosinus acidiphilus (strain DSM 22704 / JCM 16185 / SJ4) TaxID=646529 RepID=I4D2U7_DESAJ|nr:A/G-specific adenine glycosylase [Desulfosporosinus acidiphilus]AFM40121.1 A/G-specific DNA-adenine glycosylase [Desulfosporosinus acidiphilus SJ4]